MNFRGGSAMRRIGIALSMLLFANTASHGHYNMLLPDKPWAEKGEKVTFTYQFGHPFEHELFDAPEPKMIIAILPDQTTQKIDKLTKVTVPGADKKGVTAYRFSYEPATRGDHTLVLLTPPIWMAESKEFVQDSVKVVLHVQTQKNWDAGLPFALLQETQFRVTPVTRPYGLLPGMVFQAHVGTRSAKKGPTGGGRMIEIERYNAKPVKMLPPDELITFKTKTDATGVFTFAFPEPGWWSMTASHLDAKQPPLKQGGNEGPLRERATLWIHVDEKK
jgi:cobalt/nickel transport protein